MKCEFCDKQWIDNKDSILLCNLHQIIHHGDSLD